MDEMDEYVMLLESHRIKVCLFELHLRYFIFSQLTNICFVSSFLVQLVAKLKSIFDRFDAHSTGRLNGVQAEQMLVYMNRPVDSAQVAAWLQKLKENDDTIEFPEFVAQYSVSL